MDTYMVRVDITINIKLKGWVSALFFALLRLGAEDRNVECRIVHSFDIRSSAFDIRRLHLISGSLHYALSK